MSERRQCQRTLPPIRMPGSRREDKQRVESSRRASENILESLTKIKPDPGRHQQHPVTKTPTGKTRSLRRQDSLPASFLSGCFQSSADIRTKPGYQKQNCEAQKDPFPNLPFRLSIASEYDLNSPKGSAESSQKHTDFFRCKKLGGDLTAGGGQVREVREVIGSSRQTTGDVSPRSLYEMQLRYKNLVTLDRQIKFKTSQVLRGEKIRKAHTLPGIRAPIHSDINGNLELLAVLSVKQANETDKISRWDKQRLPATDSQESWLGAGSNSTAADTLDNKESVNRRSRFYENRKKLSKRKELLENRQRREALKDDNERMLITQALQLGTAQCSKSKRTWRECKGSQVAPLQPYKVEWDVPRPSALVTISGGCGNPLHKSIKITLPDCKLMASTAGWVNKRNTLPSENVNEREIFQVDLDEEASTTGSGNKRNALPSENVNEREIFQVDLDEEVIVPSDESSEDYRHAAQIPETRRTQQELVPNVSLGHSSDLLVAQDTDIFTDDSFSEVLLGAELQEEAQISEADVLLDEDESDTDEEVHRAMGAVAVDIRSPDWISRSPGSPRSVEASCRGSRPSSHSVHITDFLAVPVSSVTRCVEVLSLGSVAGSGTIDIPEIRMICATPLPPGSPD